MATSGNRSNEIDQQEATSSSMVTKEYVDQEDAGGADYPGYITSAVGTTSTDPNPTTSGPNDSSTSSLSYSPESPPPPHLKPKSSQERIDRQIQVVAVNGEKDCVAVTLASSAKKPVVSMPAESPSPQPHQSFALATTQKSLTSASPKQASSSGASPLRSVPIRMSSAAETLGAGGGGSGSTSGSGGATTAGSSSVTESEDAAAWRNFCYEHPLHAATSAMLNLGGASALSEDGAVGGNNSSNSNSILVPTYEHHYAPYSGGNKSQQQHHHQHTAHSSLSPLTTSSAHVAHHKDDKSMNEIWSSGMGGSHSTTPDDSSGSKEMVGQHQQQQQQSVVVIGGGSESDIYPLIIKKEPEDLTRRNLRQHQHVIHQQHHPDSRIMCSSGSSNGDKGGVSEHPGTVISRVMADGELVHEMIPRLESIGQHGSMSADGRDPSSGSVIHIRRPLSSHDGGDSTGMMSSTVVLDLARAGISSSGTGNQQAQYSSSPYSNNQSVSNNSHSGYDLSAPTGATPTYVVTEASAYTTINSSSSNSLRQQQQQNTYATPTPVAADPFYRDYFSNNGSSASSNPNDQQYARAVAQLAYSSSGEVHESTFVDRFIRGQSGVYKQQPQGTGLTVDLPSPDSGIGVDAVTPRDQSVAQQNFDYTELCHPGLMSGEPSMDHHPSEPQHHHHPGNSSAHGGSDEGSRTPTSGGEHSKSSMSPGSGHLNSSRSRSWHDCNRQTEADKIQIPKVMNQYGFRYFLESPISTSQRREDDRITYINKGQFYGITLEYIPDPERPLKNQTVKTMVMLVFREEKSPEDEAKAWQFWHGRQHSAKQRILDADTKNSVGLVGCIEEVSHNAICVYWNPLESSAKINVAVQCLSTDFSSQKGVKGLPLHLQIDTFDDPRDSTPVFHRGYCQVKVFCDKGAERKTRDEERRAAKRKIVVTGRNKRLEELYHTSAERSEFYHMADLVKTPALFTPDDHEKVSPYSISTSMELPSFYGHDHERKDFLDSHAGLLGTPLAVPSNAVANPSTLYSSSPVLKRRKLTPPPCERVMIYVRQENELAFTPLHLVPPTSLGLLDAIESKYKLSASTINVLYRKNCKGILAKIDDDMLKHYCNEDLFILEITTSTEEGMYDVTLKELFDT